MKRHLALAAFVLAAGTAAVHADPMRLTDDQMDQVSAGLIDDLRANVFALIGLQTSAPITANTVAAVGILAEDVIAAGETSVASINDIVGVNDVDLGD